MRAGLPATIAAAGTDRVTTAPAPTIASRPIVTPARIVALAPIDALRQTSVFANDGGGRLLRGNGLFVKVTFGPTKTSSSRDTPSQSCTPDLTMTRSPITTSFSMKT